jgi:hypothetical protein
MRTAPRKKNRWPWPPGRRRPTPKPWAAPSRISSGFSVERIENSFDQNNIGAAVNQTIQRFQIVFNQQIKGHVARAGVVYIGRDRAGATGRPKHPGNKTWFSRILCGEFITQIARKFGGGEVQLVHQLFHVVIGHGNARGVKGIGFQNIRTGF